MMRDKITAWLGAAALAVMPLAAQEAPRFDVGLDAVGALDGLSKITNKHGVCGASVSFGYTGKVAATAIPVRTSLAVNFMPGKSVEGSKVSLTGFQFASDIYINTGFDGLRLTTGLSANKWSTKVEIPGDSYTNTVKGVKLGIRLGLDYVITPRWSASVLFQGVELGTDQAFLRKENQNRNAASIGANPTWIQFGAKYHF